MLVDVNIKASHNAFGFAEQNQVLKQEDVSLALLPPVPDGELVLLHQLALLLQIDLLGQQQGEILTSELIMLKRQLSHYKWVLFRME